MRPALVAAWSDPEIARWTGVPPRHDLAAAERWIAGDVARRQRGLSLDLVITLGSTQVVVGEVGLTAFDSVACTAEIGWWLAGGHRGQGHASRAVSLFTDWAVQELAVERLVARCHRANPASAAVARRAGFVGPELGAEEIEVWRSA